MNNTNKFLHLFIITINVMIFIVAILLIAYAFSGLNEVHGIDNRYIYLFSIALFVSSIYTIAEAIDNLLEK